MGEALRLALVGIPAGGGGMAATEVVTSAQNKFKRESDSLRHSENYGPAKQKSFDVTERCGKLRLVGTRWKFNLDRRSRGKTI